MIREPIYVTVTRADIRAWLDVQSEAVEAIRAALPLWADRDDFAEQLRGALDVAQSEAADGAPRTVEIIIAGSSPKGLTARDLPT